MYLVWVSVIVNASTIQDDITIWGSGKKKYLHKRVSRYSCLTLLSLLSHFFPLIQVPQQKPIFFTLLLPIHTNSLKGPHFLSFFKGQHLLTINLWFCVYRNQICSKGIGNGLFYGYPTDNRWISLRLVLTRVTY